MWLCSPALAQTPRPVITSISVCSSGSAGTAGSCPSGTFDTHKIVLAPDGSGNAFNTFAAAGSSDEHSSVFSPGMLGANADYLFVVASSTAGNPGIGAVVLSGGSGPDKNGQWTFNIPTADGYGSYPRNVFGQVFKAPFSEVTCPTVADGNPAHQDQTFDLNYAAPGSVVKDPGSGPGALLMVYEGVNSCMGSTGGPKPGAGPGSSDAYISTGIATSLDYGKTWPTYRGTASFTFVPVPGAGQTQGPNALSGALGGNVCAGNDCTTTPPSSYGRYPVLSPHTPLATLMTAGKSIGGTVGDSAISAFVDDARPTSGTYLYTVYSYQPGPLNDPPVPNRFSDLRLARSLLNGGQSPLSFTKWNGSAFAAPGIGGVDAAILPDGAFENCGALSQGRGHGSISYVDQTQQYLLLFVCDSPHDPATGGGNRGGAWFYSTSYDLSDPAQWTSPREIAGSWSEHDTSGGCASYKGWYPTPMSLNNKPGHLSTTGYVFYLWGCADDAASPTAPKRQFSSRMFTISTGPAALTLTSGSVANGATYVAGGLVPGSWAQVKGSNLSGVSRIWAAADFAGLGNNLPTTLSGVQVKVNNLPAAVYYIDSAQVSFQVPSGVSGTASVQVFNNGVASNIVTGAAVNSAPGIFPLIVNGTNYAIGVFLDGKLAGDPSIGPAFRKAKPGENVQLYVTGLVPTPAGVLVTPQGVDKVRVTVGTVTVDATSAGLTAVGEFYINFYLPTLPDGTYPITISVNGVSSPATINSNPPGPLVLPIQH